MSLTKRIAKNIKRKGLQFPQEMYTNVYGSLAICGYMFGRKKNRETILKKWRQAKNNPAIIDWSLKDTDFIKKTLDYFRIRIPRNFPVAFVVGKYNSLFAPYVEGEVLPLREDGIMTQTLRTGLAYPIDFTEELSK